MLLLVYWFYQKKKLKILISKSYQSFLFMEIIFPLNEFISTFISSINLTAVELKKSPSHLWLLACNVCRVILISLPKYKKEL